MLLDSFLDEITDRKLGGISPQRMSKALNLPLARLAKLAHVHRNTLAHRGRSPAVQEGLGTVARIIELAAELLNGDKVGAVVWFRYRPLAGFDGKTAEELVTTGHAEAVVAHLDLLREGGYA